MGPAPIGRAALLILLLIPHGLLIYHIFSAAPPLQEAGAPAAPPPRPSEGRQLVVSAQGPYHNISSALRDARPGDTILVRRGLYKESLLIDKPWIRMLGEDRAGVILDGEGVLANGITAVNAYGVAVANFTVRNYTGTGVMFVSSDRWEMSNITSINNRIYGLYAISSRFGVMADDVAIGSGDSGFYIGEVIDCGCVIERSVAMGNTLGYSGTRASGVIIRNSKFVNNSVGIGPNTLLPDIASLVLGRWKLPLYAANHTIENNFIAYNNNRTVKGVGISETYGVPIGTGIALIGAFGNVIRNNTIAGNERWGIAEWFFFYPPSGNIYLSNLFKGNGQDFWRDGTGFGSCSSDSSGTGDVPPPCSLPYLLRVSIPNPIKEAELLMSLGRPGGPSTPYPSVLRPGLAALAALPAVLAIRPARGRRLMASLIDLLAAGSLYISLTSLLLSLLFGLSGVDAALDAVVSFTLLLLPLAYGLFVLISLIYGMLSETLFRTTAGRYIVGLRIATTKGLMPTRKRLALASLARLPDAALLGAPSIVLVLARGYTLGEALCGLRSPRR
jgi:hypothetical protein